MNLLMNKIKYLPKVWAALSFLLLFIIVFIIFFGRNIALLRLPVLLKTFPAFYSHVSNFSISYLLVGIIGYVWLMLGVETKYLFSLAALALLCNFVYEKWVPLLNTPDLTDACYGYAGTFLALVFLLAVKWLGLKPNELAGSAS